MRYRFLLSSRFRNFSIGRMCEATHSDPLELAAAARAAIKAVGAAKLARQLGVGKSTVTLWARTRVPSDRVGEVAAASGVAPAQIRPDLARLFCPHREAA